MKNELSIFILVSFLIVSVSFIIFILPLFHLTGFVLQDSSANNTNFTRNDAIQEINESEQIIQEMLKNNFTVVLMNDILIEAKRVLEQVDYAEVLRNPNSSIDKQNEAKRFLTLVNWKNLNYSNVIYYTSQIEDRKKQAFEIYDSLIAFELSLQREETIGINVSSAKLLFESANTSFYFDRYEESKTFLENARYELESLLVQNSFLSGIKTGAMNFVQRYFIHILLTVFIILLFSWFFYKKISRLILIRKVRLMEIQLKVLEDLIKKTQIERYKQNKISSLVYNIRIKTYKNKIENIKEELPVLRSRLNKLEKKFPKNKRR